MMQLNPVMRPCSCFSIPRCSFQTRLFRKLSHLISTKLLAQAQLVSAGVRPSLTMTLQIIGRSATMRMAWPCARIMASRGWSAMEAQIQKVQPNHAALPMTPWTAHALLQSRFQDGALTALTKSIPQVKLEVPGVENQTAMEAVHTRRQLRRWKYRRKRDGGKDRKFRLKYG